MKTAVFLCVLVAVFHTTFSQSEKGCPDAEDIKPCFCVYTGLTFLHCQNLSDAEPLRSVFKNSERFRYNEVHIDGSTLQYLPHEMFDKVEVQGLYLKDTTITQLFDQTPEPVEALQKLYIDRTRVLRGIIWGILEPLKNLRILTIYYNSIKTIGSDFSQYAPKNLEQLTLYDTETKSIKPGVFANFTKLDKIAIDHGKITTLTRDIFPTPWNGRFLYLNEHKISEIPKDLFSQMPNLQTLSFRTNQLSTLPENAFDGNFGGLKYLILDDNPLKCDCLMKWMIVWKPEVIQGTCEKPKDKQGKQLKDLEPGDFNCR
ncbi:uncharacterized protein CDAR_177841 [Caerostris darwini]|uniref:LRRCT domain-containing protein n=1 Tax=Caerostris darwini TaxID=1538125 RepID=A0AAV4T8L1_9ARAC|nr:uncharacterized protein CDAR_177841 [Caerostris darwini]